MDDSIKTLVMKVTFECENCKTRDSYEFGIDGNSGELEDKKEKIYKNKQFGLKKCSNCGHIQSWMMPVYKIRVATVSFFLVFLLSIIALVTTAYSIGDLPLELGCTWVIITVILVFLIPAIIVKIIKPNKIKVISTGYPILRTIAVVDTESDIHSTHMKNKCDICYKDIKESASAIYTSEAFRTVITNGFEPDEATIQTLITTVQMLNKAAMALRGDFTNMLKPSEKASSKDFVDQWKKKAKLDITDWCLCTDCAERAEKYHRGRIKICEKSSTRILINSRYCYGCGETFPA